MRKASLAPLCWLWYTNQTSLTQSDHQRSILLSTMLLCDIHTPALLISTSGVRGRRSKSCWTEVLSMTSAQMGRTAQLGAAASTIDLVSSRGLALRPDMMIVLAPAKANCIVTAWESKRRKFYMVSKTGNGEDYEARDRMGINSKARWNAEQRVHIRPFQSLCRHL